MNPRSSPFAVVHAALIVLSVLAAAQPARAQDVFDIDAVHSAVTFRVRHLFSYTSGRFSEFSGTLWYDAAQPQNSRIEIAIEVASIDTDSQQRDDHLRSADFFDATQHPRITFKSTKVEPGAEPQQLKVTGDLTLRGTTRPVTAMVDVIGFGDTESFGYRGGVIGRARIDRREFGMVWSKALETGGLVVGNDVEIEVPLEVARRQTGS